MTNPLEPLADYLEPIFRNIYDTDDFEAQPWTPELQQAVSRFVSEVDEPLYACALNRLGIETVDKERSEAVQLLTSERRPWEVAFAFREAAVILRPVPDELFKDVRQWSDEDEREDVVLWLQTHLGSKQLRVLGEEAAYYPEDWCRDYPEDIPGQLSGRMSPAELLAVWRRVTASAPSDLTDAELQLLAPFLPRKFGWNEGMILEHGRRVINGWLYRCATASTWAKIPYRYERPQALQPKWVLWRKRGVFQQMLAGLRDNPEAGRLVEWLEKEIGG